MGFFSRKPAPQPVPIPAEERPAPEEPPTPEEPNAFEPDTDFIEEPAPAASIPEPLRALAPGTFLSGSIEIKEVLYRGTVNYYFAAAGDWNSPLPKFLAERAAGPEPYQPLEGSPLIPEGAHFAENARDYLAWEWADLTPFSDWRSPANDETYLRLIKSLAAGLAALEKAGRKPEFQADALFFDEDDQPWFYGFADPAQEGDDPSVGLTGLAELSTHLLKTGLSQGATLRLDDILASLPLSEELKTFARALHSGEFASLDEVISAVDRFPFVTSTETALDSDVGMERQLNEDCGLTFKLSLAGHLRNAELELLAVADGMGGHEGGEVASDLTLQALQRALLSRLSMDWRNNTEIRSAWRDILDEVNAAVVRMNEDPPYAALRHKPGATLVCALRVGSRLFIGNVGDSRAYRWNPETGLERLTVDHSYVQELIDAGRLRPEDAWGHPDSSVITSHIGMPRGGQRDVFLRLLRPGDKLFLVSDGVVDMIRDVEIEAIAREAANPRALCEALRDEANDTGGLDNITVAAMFCS